MPIASVIFADAGIHWPLIKRGSPLKPALERLNRWRR